MNRIGERIKRKREQLKLQLNDLARLVGVSSSALSQIENAKASPSITTLKAIAESLHTTVGELIGENESFGRSPVIHKNETRLVAKSESGTGLYLLSGHEPGNNMDAYLLAFTEGSDVKGLFTEFSGQVFCRILQGKFNFKIEGKHHSLKSGDNVYFSMKSFDSALYIGKGNGEVIWVISPPFFNNDLVHK